MNILLKTLAVLVLFGGFATAVAAAPLQKPQVPAQLSITPMQRDADGETIKPGEAVALTISATGFLEIDELQIETFLLGGAEFVSGERSWRGRASRNEAKEIIMTVRTPLHGSGMVRARVSLYRAGEKLTTKQTLYDLGSNKESSPKKPARPSRKDSKGREVVNY